MDFESIGPYSPSTVYGELTSPFTPKLVKINAHTPFDKNEIAKEGKAAKNNNTPVVDEEVFSKKTFKARPQTKNIYKNISTDRVYEEKFKNKNFNEIKNEPNNNVYINNKDQTDEKQFPNIASFSQSTLSKDDNNIIKNALKNGHSTKESVNIKNAHNAYKKSAILTKNPVEVVSSCAYRVY